MPGQEDPPHRDKTAPPLLVAASVPATPAGAIPTKEPSRRKPNLLFLIADEQRPDTMAVYGNRKIHAPSLNKFATECVVFQNAYVTQPVCTPSRSSLQTGLWPHTSGILENNIPLPRRIPCVPELINDPDYQTGYIGKWHLGNEILPQHGYKEWVSMEDGYSKFFGVGVDKNLRTDYFHYLVQQGYKPGKNGMFSRDFASHLPIEQCKPKFLETKACDFLRRHGDTPFILYVSFLEPHMPYYGPLNKEHDPKIIDIPPSFSVPLGTNEPLRYRQLAKKYRAREIPDEQSLREVTARYWGLVTQVDRSVGEILKSLETLGLADDTLVVYTSDHGDMMGSHGLMAKSVMYQEAVRVPWLMRIPWLGQKQRLIPNPVSNIDMVPTLLDLMGSQAGKGLPGQSLVPLIEGGKVKEDCVFIEWNGDSDDKKAGPYKYRAVITPDGWKLSLSDKDKNQLFNLSTDPGEMTNLFDVAEYQDVVHRLTQKIREWQEKTQDPLKL